MKRFVSYLYSIHNNQKIHNAGFARIELRTGRNRIDIHMRENGYSGKTGIVYLFIRRRENIQGISIGNIIFRNNQADFRYEQAEENIGQTPWQIMQMNGILIMVDDRAAFLSQWYEEPIDTARFEIWKANDNESEENGEDDHTQSRNKGMMRHPAEGAGQDAAANEEINTENKPVPENNRIQDDGRGQNEPDADRNQSKDMSARSVSDRSQSKNMSARSGGSQSKNMSARSGVGRNQSKNTSAESGGNKITSGNQSPVQPVETKVQTETEKDAFFEQSEPELQDLQTEDEHERQVDIQTAELQPQPVSLRTQTWRNMLRTYPVLNQFAENDQILCVRIEIKDVRLLPEKYWSMVNNSFLLHGFFNYRYLAFGRIGQNWFIGIPGIYQNQEHAMASIFGFPDFLPQAQKNERGEQPGYWYRILEI